LRRTKDNTSSVGVPFVSVIIAARNEEATLPHCLDSLTQQIYPRDRFEVIVANDGSTDRTNDICDHYAKSHSHIHSFITVENPNLPGKPNALSQAIERAAGEVIMITDADCIVPPTWIESTAKRYSPEVGLVGGMTLQRSANAFEGMQSLDWAYILGVASASAALDRPLGSIGNNLSFRRKAYDEVGGYAKIKFSITEDYSLVQAILGTKRWKFLYPLDENLLVESLPCPTIRSLIQQKHRWGKGGLDMKFWGFVIMAVGFSMHAALLWNLMWFGLASTGVALLLKMIADYVFLFRILDRLKRTDEIKSFYWFELYYTLYVLALPFLVFFGGKVKWKGRLY
jgi:cellulose synthase/poly-beta-1,6-N-acetylglucosamine synthase-like glycosyltransferase